MTGAARYAASGVDEPREQEALTGMLREFARTRGVRTGIGSVVAETDHFGSLVRLGGSLGLAISTDGVGTKLIIAQETKRYTEIARDLVANNVNDILCMGATPIALVDYIGIDVADEKFLHEFSRSLADAALDAKIAIVGGEIAQIGGMLNPSHTSPRFDVVATAVGLCMLEDSTAPNGWPRALDRKNVRPGHHLIALTSSGLHSNGFSLARRVLCAEAGFSLDSKPHELHGETIANALLTPTRIYVQCLLPLLQEGLISGLANISGGGFLTIARLNPAQSFELSAIPPPPPIFELIQRSGDLRPSEMLSTFNMGLGMVMAVEPHLSDRVLSSLRQLGENPLVVGKVIKPEIAPGEIIIRDLNLRGIGHDFQTI